MLGLWVGVALAQGWSSELQVADEISTLPLVLDQLILEEGLSQRRALQRLPGYAADGAHLDRHDQLARAHEAHRLERLAFHQRRGGQEGASGGRRPVLRRRSFEILAPPLGGLVPYQGQALGAGEGRLWEIRPLGRPRSPAAVTGPFDTSADGEALAYVDDKRLVIERGARTVVGLVIERGARTVVEIPDGTSVTALRWGPTQLVIGLRRVDADGAQHFGVALLEPSGAFTETWEVPSRITDVAWTARGPLLVADDRVAILDRRSGLAAIRGRRIKAVSPDKRRIYLSSGGAGVEGYDAHTWRPVDRRAEVQWRWDGTSLSAHPVRRLPPWRPTHRAPESSGRLFYRGGWRAWSDGAPLRSAHAPAQLHAEGWIALGPGRVVTGGPEGDVFAWTPELTQPSLLHRGSRPVLGVDVAPSGDAIAAVDGQTLRVWRGGALALEQPSDAGQVRFLDEERLVVAGTRWIELRPDGSAQRILQDRRDSGRWLLVADGEAYAWRSTTATLEHWGPDGLAPIHVGGIPQLGGPDAPLIVAWHDELWRIEPSGPVEPLGLLASPGDAAPLPPGPTPGASGGWGYVPLQISIGSVPYRSLRWLPHLEPGHALALGPGGSEELGPPTRCGLPPPGPARSGPLHVVTVASRSPEPWWWTLRLAASDRWSHVHIERAGASVVHERVGPELLASACVERRFRTGRDLAAGIRSAAAIAGPDSVVVLVDGTFAVGRPVADQLQEIRAALAQLGDVPLLVGVPGDRGVDVGYDRLVWEALVGSGQVARPGEDADALLERWSVGRQ